MRAFLVNTDIIYLPFYNLMTFCSPCSVPEIYGSKLIRYIALARYRPTHVRDPMVDTMCVALQF